MVKTVGLGNAHLSSLAFTRRLIFSPPTHTIARRHAVEIEIL